MHCAEGEKAAHRPGTTLPRRPGKGEAQPALCACAVPWTLRYPEVPGKWRRRGGGSCLRRSRGAAGRGRAGAVAGPGPVWLS